MLTRSVRVARLRGNLAGEVRGRGEGEGEDRARYCTWSCDQAKFGRSNKRRESRTSGRKNHSPLCARGQCAFRVPSSTCFSSSCSSSATRVIVAATRTMRSLPRRSDLHARGVQRTCQTQSHAERITRNADFSMATLMTEAAKSRREERSILTRQSASGDCVNRGDCGAARSGNRIAREYSSLAVDARTRVD